MTITEVKKTSNDDMTQDSIGVKKNRKAQIIKCKCGNTVAACVEPYCYTDKDWLKSLRTLVLKGYTVEMIESNIVDFKKCTCIKEKQAIMKF